MSLASCFAVDGKKRLKRRIRNQGSLLSFSFLSHALPRSVHPSALFCLPQYESSLPPPPPLFPLSPFSHLQTLLNVPVQTNSYSTRRSSSLDECVGAAARPRRVGWPVTKWLLVPSAAPKEQRGWVSARPVGGQRCIIHITEGLLKKALFPKCPRVLQHKKHCIFI